MRDLPYHDRQEAGIALVSRLERYRGQLGVVVLALPRGGVPVAAEIARELALPLDVFLVRKLGVPSQEELAFGAVASGGTRVLNHGVIDALQLSAHIVEAVSAQAWGELERRERELRSGRPFPALGAQTVILVDDGLATGATMLAAVRAIREHDPARIIVAAPVASAEATRDLRGEADEVIAVAIPDPFSAVGHWYMNFAQITDDEVRVTLGSFAHKPA